VFGAGDAQHVSKAAEYDFRSLRNLNRLIDRLGRGNAYRAAGPVEQADILGQASVDPVFQDCMGLTATDFHNRPSAPHAGGYHLELALDESTPAIFVKVLHA
jgi:hypothetical protein